MTQDKILKEYIEKKDFDNCIDVLQNEIIKNIEAKIRDKYIDYNTTDIFDLMIASEKYLNKYDKEIIKDMYKIINGNSLIEIKVSLLIELYDASKKE